MKSKTLLIASICLLTLSGCHHKKPMITAVSLNNDCHWGQETGIPFYLPKPLLIISKNFRNIETARVGLTDSAPIPTGFDDQSKYADVNARTNFNFDGGTGGAVDAADTFATNSGNSAKSAPVLHSPSGAPMTPFDAPSDGLGPDTFYTYHIVFVPDLTQKYGLRIRGGAGEIRAAMNLVNGWQYTGMGPYYSKNSSTAQNILSAGISTRLGGQAAKDVLTGVANLVGTKPGSLQGGGQFDANDQGIQSLSETISQLPVNVKPMVIPAFAEIHVYEPSLGPDGMMTWCEIASCAFNRDYLGVKRTEKVFAPKTDPPPTDVGELQSGGQFSNDVAQSAIASVFGIPRESSAIQPLTGGSLQAGGEQGSIPIGGNQINIHCGPDCQKPCCKPASRFGSFRMPNFAKHFAKKDTPKTQRRVVNIGSGGLASSLGQNIPNPTGSTANDSGAILTSTGGTLQSGGEFDNQAVIDGAIFNQPTLNQPNVFRGSPPENEE